MKCQHGEVITKFCISDICTANTSSACFYCLKKYHNHHRHQTLSYQELQKLMASFNIQKDKRMKQSALKQLLNNYFQNLKNCISRSIDKVCINMLDRVSHSYLFSFQLLEVFKKLKLKQFSNIKPQELRRLHQLSLKNKSSELQQIQQKLYQCQVIKIKSTIESVNKLFESYHNEVVNYDQKNCIDPFYYRAIEQLTDKILELDGKDELLNKINTPQIKIRISGTTKNNPQSEIKFKGSQPKQQPKLLTLLEYKNIKSSESLNSNSKFNSQQLNILRPKKQRKISIKLQSNNAKINESNYQQQQIAKSHHSMHFEPIQLNKNPSLLTQQNFHWKQCRSIELIEKSKSKSSKKIIDYKKITIPHLNTQDQQIQFDNHENVRKKVINLQINKVNLNNSKEIQSPLLKRKIQSNLKRTLNLIEVQYQNHTIQVSNNNSNENILISHEEMMTPISSFISQIHLNENQLKSLALLLEAIKLPSKQAIIFLRKSLQYCPDNLSTAEYLSFLLIEENYPKECLELCNFMMGKTLIQSQNYNISVHLLNNKAAALNLLGRFSESIQFLQRVLGNIQKDTLFKNLGDAYYALGIYEKSILNYQKCIQLNKDYDQGYYNMAVCMYCQQHYKESFNLVSQAIHLNPNKEEYIELYRNNKIKLF